MLKLRLFCVSFYSRKGAPDQLLHLRQMKFSSKIRNFCESQSSTKDEDSSNLRMDQLSDSSSQSRTILGLKQMMDLSKDTLKGT